MLIQSTPSRPNSQSTINKLLTKDLKELIFSLDSTQLIGLFRNLQIQSQVTSMKQFTKIGLKCSQCHTVFESFQSKGYGRDEHEAMINSIKIILESMISSSHRIEAIKKALKYCSRYKQPLISGSQSNAAYSSANKKSVRKVQGLENLKMTKRHLQYQSFQSSANKENIGIRMNETLEINMKQTDKKVFLNTTEALFKQEESSSSTLFATQEEDRSIVDQKCSQLDDPSKCIYFEIQKHSEKEIKSLNARIKLLEEENSILKDLLLKGFNKDFSNSNQSNHQNNQQTAK